MKTYIFITLCLFGLCVSGLKAQNTEKATIEQQKEAIISEEREALKNEVEVINEKLDNAEIGAVEAQMQKEAAAERRALNIDNRIAILENQLALEERNEQTTSSRRVVQEDNNSAFEELGNVFRIRVNKKRKYDRRTYSDFVLAVGFNNVITEGESFDDTPFKIGGSRFAELGWAWRTRVFQNSNWLRVKYGFSFQFNGLKPVDNQYFVTENGMTYLEEFPHELRKSKFRMDNLVFPLHFEFGPSKKTETENYLRYSTRNQFKVGLGGYAGFNIGNRQKLKYSDENGRQKDKFKGSYNTSNLVYGLSGYVGWNWAALYVKYDLNPIFRNNELTQRNISVGLRWDID